MKIKRPRFSLKVLLALPVLVALYIAAGSATRNYGIPRISDAYGNNAYVAPFVTEGMEFASVGRFDMETGKGIEVNGGKLEMSISYYGWFFGIVWRHPFTRQVTEPVPYGALIGEIIEGRSWAHRHSGS